MKRIGVWMRSVREADLCPPWALVGKIGDDVRRALQTYLSQGDVFETYRHIIECAFSCGYETPALDRSDGYWVWPEELAHYVGEHGVIVPEEFARHVLAGATRRPEAEWDSCGIDGAFWTAWVRANRPAGFEVARRRALEAADAEAQSLLAAEAGRRERAEGTWDRTCQWAGCSNRSLSGRLICGACSLRGEEDRFTSAAYSPSRLMLDRGT